MRRLAAAIVVLALVAAGLYGLRLLARSRTYQLFGRLVDRADVSERVVALTFDDGPAGEYLEAVLDPLESRGVKATFFVTGAELTAAPEAARRLVTAGHELGNHTYSHARMVLRRPAFVRDEIDRTDAAIRAAGYRGPIHVRPPYGYKLVVLPWQLSRSGRITVTWDVEPDSFPNVSASAEGIAEHVAERVRPGSIVLLHVWYRSRQTSRDAVPLILDRLTEDGYRFVTVSQLLAR